MMWEPDSETLGLIRVPYMNPTVLGLQAQGILIRFLHYLRCWCCHPCPKHSCAARPLTGFHAEEVGGTHGNTYVSPGLCAAQLAKLFLRMFSTQAGCLTFG